VLTADRNFLAISQANFVDDETITFEEHFLGYAANLDEYAANETNLVGNRDGEFLWFFTTYLNDRSLLSLFNAAEESALQLKLL
jgi:hypothetical protein